MIPYKQLSLADIFTTSLLIVFLKYSQELRDFCGFHVCHASIKKRTKDYYLQILK